MVARLHAQHFEPEAIASAITRTMCALIVAAAVVTASSAVNAQDQLPSIQGTAVLPRDLSPWGMFMNADVVVKVVMIGLVVASVVTWTVWLPRQSNSGGHAGRCAPR